MVQCWYQTLWCCHTPWYLYDTCTVKKVTNGNTKNIYAVDSILHYMMTYASSETPKNVKRVQKNAFWQQTGVVTVSHHQIQPNY